MEKRSRRRVPELVTRPAFQGLSENEIGRARISMMARNATFRSRAGYRSARPITSKSSLSACNARPVHTVGSNPVMGRCPLHDRSSPESGSQSAPLRCRGCAITGLMHCSKHSLFDHLVGAAINSSLLTSSPGRSSSAIRISNARLPRRTGLPDSVSSLRVGNSRNGSNAIDVAAGHRSNAHSLPCFVSSSLDPGGRRALRLASRCRTVASSVSA